MKFVNLTGKPLVILGESHRIILKLNSDGIIRIKRNIDLEYPLGKIEVRNLKTEFEIAKTDGTVLKEIPDYEFNVSYIIPINVLKALPGREDMVSPGESVMDEAGNFLGYDGFVAIY